MIMDMIKLIVQIAAAVSGSLAALMSLLFFVRLRWPAPVLWILKLFVSAWSPWLTLIGVLCTVVGIATGSVFVSLIGMYDVLTFMIYIIRVTRPPGASGSFENAFGLCWEARIKTAQKKYFLTRRTVFKLPAVPDPRMEQHVVFATIPGTDRQLLCDIWQPPENVPPSRLAFVYLHGSAFYMLDKDCGTRPLFRQLAAQGHVIMDVAYRLSPETDIMGMVNDVKRAIIWMKENAAAYGINPHQVVVGGGSAGGHLALLTAYTADDPLFTPKELEGKDISTCAVISLYGTNDLKAIYYHTNQQLTTRSTPDRPKKAAPVKMPEWIKKRMGKDFHRLGMDKGFENAGALAPLLGGHPDECPAAYALFSPVNHVHPGCPPTLLIHGEHDIMAPVTSTHFLQTRLVEEKVPTVAHFLPQTDHAFDLVVPNLSPAAHTAFYDVERFLALQIKTDENKKRGLKNTKQISQTIHTQ